MIVTISEFARLAQDVNGHLMSLGKMRLACQARTAAGAFAPLQQHTKFVRVATDTAIQMDVLGGTTDITDELFVANSVEYIAVDGGEILTITAA